MFKAIRDNMLGLGTGLGTTWRNLRGNGMIRLFAFEFAVVLLGVLAAQALQSWVAERRAQAELTEAEEQFEEQAAQALLVAAVWESGLPCLRTRVDEIMLSAGERTAPLPGTLDRPSFMTANLDGFSEDNVLRLRNASDRDRFYAIQSLVDNTSRHKRIAEQVAGDWKYFQLIDPAFGPVSADDYAAARQAAARIQSNFEILGFTTREMLGTSTKLDLDLPALQADTHLRPASDCEAIRRDRSMVADRSS